jgi:hypothetical protein
MVIILLRLICWFFFRGLEDLLRSFVAGGDLPKHRSYCGDLLTEASTKTLVPLVLKLC